MIRQVSALIRHRRLLPLQFRTLYIKPKQKAYPMLQFKQKKEVQPIQDIEFSKIKERILETGGNLKIVEVLLLNSKYLNTVDSKNMYIVNGDSNRKSIFNELDIYDPILKNLINKISIEILTNNKLKEFIILEFIELKKQNQLDKIRYIWYLLKLNLIKKSFTGEDFQTILRLNTDSNDKFIESLIDLSLYLNNLNIVTNLAIKNEISTNLLKSVINSLIIKNPRYEEFTLNSILNLIIKKNYRFSETENIEILQNKFSYLNLFLQKKFLEYLITSTNYDKNNKLKLQNYYKLIEINFSLKNYTGCYIVWSKIRIEFPSIKINQHDIKILSKLVKIFNKNSLFLSKEIVNSFKPFNLLNKDNYNNEIIIHNLIRYYTQKNDSDSINELLSNLDPSFQRRTLDELLRINLFFKDSNKNVETLLKQIMDNFGNLSLLENSLIVESLIQRHQFDEALNFADKLNVNVAKNSYLKIINHVINKAKGELKSKKQQLIINTFLTKVSSVKKDENYDISKDSFWSMISSFFIKFLCVKKEGIEFSKKLYLNSTNLTNKSYYLDNDSNSLQKKLKALDELNLNPFKNPNDVNFLIINDESKLIILKTIYFASNKFNDQNTINWCYKRFYELGLSKLEIMMFINPHLSLAIEDCPLSSVSHFNEFWYNMTPKYIKHNPVIKSLH